MKQFFFQGFTEGGSVLVAAAIAHDVDEASKIAHSNARKHGCNALVYHSGIDAIPGANTVITFSPRES